MKILDIQFNYNDVYNQVMIHWDTDLGSDYMGQPTPILIFCQHDITADEVSKLTYDNLAEYKAFVLDPEKYVSSFSNDPEAAGHDYGIYKLTDEQVELLQPAMLVIYADNKVVDNINTIINASYNDSKLVVDQIKLLHAKTQLLTSYCDTCLDKHQLEKITLCCFYEQLYNTAISEKKYDEAGDFYEKLCRLLNIKFNYTSGAHTKSGFCKQCCTCTNGICSLC